MYEEKAEQDNHPVGIGARIVGVAQGVTKSPLLKRQIDNTKDAGVVITKLAVGRMVLTNITNIAVSSLPFGMGKFIVANPLQEALFKFTMAQALAIMSGTFVANLDDDDPKAKYAMIACDAATLAGMDALREASGVEEFIMDKILTKDVLDKIKPLAKVAS